MGKLGTFTKGATLSKADIKDAGTPFILYGELYTTYNEVTSAIVRKTDKTAAPEQYSRVGDVIIPTSGETPEEIATATCVMVPDVILAGDLNIYRNKTIDGRLISYIVNHVINGTIARLAQGKSVVHIKAEELSKLFVNYPSYAEQQKLIRFLALIDKRIEKQRQLIEALKSYKRGALSKLFPKKGETTPEYRFAGFTEPWEQQKWCETVDMSKEMVDPRNGTYNNLPHVAPGNIESFTGRLFDNVKTVEQEELISGKFHFHAGDIIYCKINPQLGKYYFAQFEGLTSADAYVLKAKNGVIQDFLFAVLQTKDFFDYSVSVSKRSGMPKINREELNAYLFLAPSELEQEQIGAFLMHLDHLISAQRSRIDEYERMKAGLLQQLFI